MIKGKSLENKEAVIFLTADKDEILIKLLLELSNEQKGYDLKNYRIQKQYAPFDLATHIMLDNKKDKFYNFIIEDKEIINIKNINLF